MVLIGAGGLGLQAIAMLRALGHRHIVSVDTAAEKRDAALAAGATAVVDGSGPDVAARIMAAAGGAVPAAIDFVNASATARTGYDVLDKGGRLVLVGIAGGEITLSLATMIFKGQAVLGNIVGSVPELREVVRLAREGKLEPVPIREFPKDEANAALQALERGAVTGRAVLVA